MSRVEEMLLPLESFKKQRHTYWYQGMPWKMSLKKCPDVLLGKSLKEHLSILQVKLQNHSNLKNSHKWQKNINITTILKLADGKPGLLAGQHSESLPGWGNSTFFNLLQPTGGFGYAWSFRPHQCHSPLPVCFCTWHIRSLCLFKQYFASRRKKPPWLFSPISVGKQLRKGAPLAYIRALGLFAWSSALPGPKCSDKVAQRQCNCMPWAASRCRKRQALMETLKKYLFLADLNGCCSWKLHKMCK